MYKTVLTYMNRTASRCTHCFHGLATGLLRIRRVACVASSVWQALFKTIKFAASRRNSFCFTPRDDCGTALFCEPYQETSHRLSSSWQNWVHVKIVCNYFSPFTYIPQITCALTENCALLGYYAAFLWIFTPEDVTDRLSRKIGKKTPLLAV